jgi:primosomal protein N' (replication factor Y)
MPIVDVLMPLALDQCYSYRTDLPLAPGDVVAAPLGTRESVGVVWDAPEGADRGGGTFGAGDNLKSVAAKLDWPRLEAPLRRFIDRVAAYTMQPRGMVMRMALRDPRAGRGLERPRVGVRASGRPPGRMTPARARTLRAAEGGVGFAKAELARLAGVSSGVVDALVDDGALETYVIEAAPGLERVDPAAAGHALTPEQAAAAEPLVRAAATAGFSTTLLEGVTGSGKTEVYFEAVAAAVAAGRQALILMPEIALTAAFEARFERRFGVKPALWHSGVSPAQRGRMLAAVASGEAQAVAGARSALFLPFARLGLVVVDEEHEGAYKQEDGVSYNARDMAILRAQQEGAACILASATPSIETRVNVARGRFGHVRLASRYARQALPALAAIDLRREGPKRGEWIAPRLEAGIRGRLERGEQSLLFLNRRGFAPLTLCRACGHRWRCPNCSAWLVEHRFRRALVCHHCGHAERRPARCEACGTEDSLVACGPGVERLAEEVAAKFPDARRIVLSSDFPGGAQRLRDELEAVARGEFAIVIGTQLLAKGHNFPGVTLVGVIDADIGLASGDPRAAERTFQVLQQATGRAGRGDRPGEGLLQTHQPDHPVMRALLAGDAERFYAEEIAEREAAELPPFGRLAALIVSGTDREETERHGRALALAAHEYGFAEAITLGPAEAPLAQLRGRHRFRLLVKGPRSLDLQGHIAAVLKAAPKPRGNIRVQIDIDPMSFV